MHLIQEYRITHTRVYMLYQYSIIVDKNRYYLINNAALANEYDFIL